MKTKLSPLQELRLKRSQLKNECTEYEQKLQGNWQYAKGHFGRLAVGTVLSSAKSGIGDLFSLVSGKKQNSEEEEEEDKSSSVVTQMLLGAAPFIWEMVQPMIVGMIMKKVKSLFGGGEKKKKKIKKVKKKASDLD